MSPLLLLIFIVPSTIIFVLGRYIGNTGYIEVLKSYDDKKLYDKEKLSEYVRKLMYFTSISTVISCLISVGLAYLINKDVMISVFLVVYALITIHYIIKLRLSCRKFEIGVKDEKSRHLDI